MLAAVGSSLVGLAGCTGEMPWEEELRDPGGEYRPNAIPESEITPPAIARGELLDDFAEPSVWAPLAGERSGTSDDALVGDRALRVTDADGRRAGVYRAFEDPIDLSERDLSVALALDSPAGAVVTVELQAPSTDHGLISRRRVPSDLDDWIRIDVGYTDRQGEPDERGVEGMRIWVDGTDDEPVAFSLDDLRATPGGERGGVVLTFDGRLDSAYDEILEITDEVGLAGVLAVRPSLIDEPGGLSVDRLERFDREGWDVASFPLRREPLPELSTDEQRAVIEGEHRTLVDLGFEAGARHFFTPYDRLDASTLGVVREVHETGFVFGGSPNAFPPSDPHTISTVDGTDSSAVQRLVESVLTYNQLLVLRFGALRVDADDTASTAYLRELLAFLDAREVDVLTASDMLDTVE